MTTEYREGAVTPGAGSAVEDDRIGALPDVVDPLRYLIQGNIDRTLHVSRLKLRGSADIDNARARPDLPAEGRVRRGCTRSKTPKQTVNYERCSQSDKGRGVHTQQGIGIDVVSTSLLK